MFEVYTASSEPTLTDSPIWCATFPARREADRFIRAELAEQAERGQRNWQYAVRETDAAHAYGAEVESA